MDIDRAQARRVKHGLRKHQPKGSNNYDVRIKLAQNPLFVLVPKRCRLAEIGSKLLQKVLYAVEQGLVTPVAQLESGALYATKISKEEARIDWSQDALQIRRQIRAFNPSPGAMSRLGQTEIKIWQARLATNSAGKCGEILQADASGLLVACGTQALCLEILQKSGGRRLAAKDFLQGFQVVPGMTLEL